MTRAPDGDRSPPPEEEELVPLDDAVIGRAFRWSLLVLLGLGVLVLALVVLLPSGERPPPGATPRLEAPKPAPRAEDAPDVRFEDVTRAAGITFVHVTGAHGEKLLPETMGSGCAFFDYDGDGDPDLLFVNGAPWEWDRTPDTKLPTQALFRNDGHGHFQDVTHEAGLDIVHHGMGVAVGDIDGDGDPDVLITGVGGNRLLRNDGGHFVEITDEAGVRGPKDAWTTSAGFCDLDADGDLDLFVCAYVRWSRKIDLEQNYTLQGIGRAYGPPTSFSGAQCQLYRNDGHGHFTDVSKQAGILQTNPATGVPVGKSLALAFADLDEDGDLDVFVANDTVRNFLFENLGGLRFRESGELAGVAYNGAGRATGAMGTDVADLRGDGEPGVAVGNFASEMSSLYVGRKGALRFNDHSVSEGLGAPSRRALSFGLFFFDYDLDGRQDLFQTNGHLEQAINEVQPSQHYEQASQLFWNAGPKARAVYAEVPADRVGDLARKVVGRGCAYADIDGDGDLDLVITQSGRAPLLLRNDQALGHHWLRVRLDTSRGSPIGARLTLKAGGAVQRRLVMPTRSYLSQVELPVTFGLGTATKVDALTVRWPDGRSQDVPVAGVDREIRVPRP
jgi:hypothetical protein